MAHGSILGRDMRPLYGSEIKFGYEHKIAGKDMLYRVDGEKLTFRQICDRLPDISETLIHSRLHQTPHFEYTWACLARPAGTLSPEGVKALTDTLTTRRKKRAAAIILQKDRYLHKKKLRDGHADIEGVVKYPRAKRSSNTFRTCPRLQMLVDFFNSEMAANTLDTMLSLQSSDPECAALMRVVSLVFLGNITYSARLEDPSNEKERHAIEIMPEDRRMNLYQRLLKEASAISPKQTALMLIAEGVAVEISLVSCKQQLKSQLYVLDIEFIT